MAEWQVIGQQKYLVDEDTVSWELRGDLTVPEVSEIFHRCRALQAAQGYVLFLITIIGPWSFPPAARKFLAEFHRQQQPVGSTAIVGVSVAMAILIELVLRAVSLVSGHQPPTRFFRNLDDARAWLEKQRAGYKPSSLAP